MSYGANAPRLWTVIGYYADADPGDRCGHYIGEAESNTPEGAIAACYADTDAPEELIVICAVDETGNVYEA